VSSHDAVFLMLHDSIVAVDLLASAGATLWQIRSAAVNHVQRALDGWQIADAGRRVLSTPFTST
jgi:hypothetical protein